MIKRQRTERGQFDASVDIETLMMDALRSADAWQRIVSADDYKGENANRPERSRKRKGSGGREVTLKERLAFAPAVHRSDPLVEAEFDISNGMHIKVHLGHDYSLPANWYGDLTGVSRHYDAVERLADAVKNDGGGQSGRCNQGSRIVPIGPDGTMKWLVTRSVKIGPKRGRKVKVTHFVPVTADNVSLFYDNMSAHVSNQRMD